MIKNLTVNREYSVHFPTQQDMPLVSGMISEFNVPAYWPGDVSSSGYIVNKPPRQRCVCYGCGAYFNPITMRECSYCGGSSTEF